MRSPSTLSETRFNFSFFLTTPAKKPRTECCCQSVAFMMAAIVVPFASRSIASTASCLEEDGAAAFGDAGFDVTALDEAVGLDRVALLLVGCFFARAGLRAALADLDFDMLVAIWLSLSQRQHRVLP